MFDVGEWVLAPFFPGARAIAEHRFSSLERIAEVFADVGLHAVAHEKRSQETAATADELVERTRLRADSTLELLPDAEFQRGVARLTDAAGNGSLVEPVVETMDLVVFGR